MSVENLLFRTFKKYSTNYITILEEVQREGELEALKKRIFQPLQVVHCFWEETTHSENTEGGEVQYYTAKTRFLKSDLGEDVRRLNQYCRVIARVVVDEWQEDEEWLIETIQPKRIGNFEMIELTLKLPKEGNRIR